MTDEQTILDALELVGYPEGGYQPEMDAGRAALDRLVARAETAEREVAYKKKALRNCREAHLAAEARVAALEAALRHLARSDSWEIVGDAENNIEECGLMLKGGETPWQFARAALAQPAEEGTA